MRVIEVVPTLEQEASGPSYSVPRLAKGLADLGHTVLLMSAGGQAVSVEPPLRHLRYDRDLAATPLLKSLELSAGLNAGLRLEAADADLIHANGLWTFPTLYPAWAARRAGKPLVVSPRGTLSPVALARSPWRKRAFWGALQGPAVSGAGILHATSEQEYQDVRAFGLRQPVAIIPNGVDLPAPAARPVRSSGPRRLLYLGRIHPIKGLDVLLRAWAGLEPRFGSWELRLVGPTQDGYDLELKALAAQLGLTRVTFAGPSYGSMKSDEYQAADLYVLPSFTENFGMSVAEALAAGAPVVTTTGMPWQGVVTEGCGWRTAADPESLERTLTEAMSLSDDERRAMGDRGRKWMARAFSWSGVAASMAEAYAWLLGGGPPPTTVRVD